MAKAKATSAIEPGDTIETVTVEIVERAPQEEVVLSPQTLAEQAAGREALAKNAQ